MKWLSCCEVLQRETLRRDSGQQPSLLERAGIVFHLTLCRTCRMYMVQVASIQEMVHRMAGKGTGDEASLGATKKEQFREALEREAKSCGCSPRAADPSCGSSTERA